MWLYSIVHQCGHYYFSHISFQDEPHLEITVCFSQKDSDTLFPQKTKAVRHAKVWHAPLHFGHV